MELRGKQRGRLFLRINSPPFRIRMPMLVVALPCCLLWKEKKRKERKRKLIFKLTVANKIAVMMRGFLIN